MTENNTAQNFNSFDFHNPNPPSHNNNYRAAPGITDRTAFLKILIMAFSVVVLAIVVSVLLSAGPKSTTNGKVTAVTSPKQNLQSPTSVELAKYPQFSKIALLQKGEIWIKNGDISSYQLTSTQGKIGQFIYDGNNKNIYFTYYNPNQDLVGQPIDNHIWECTITNTTCKPTALVTDKSFNILSLKLSPDGSNILYNGISQDTKNSTEELVIYNIANNEYKSVFNNPFSTSYTISQGTSNKPYTFFFSPYQWLDSYNILVRLDGYITNYSVVYKFNIAQLPLSTSLLNFNGKTLPGLNSLLNTKNSLNTYYAGIISSDNKLLVVPVANIGNYLLIHDQNLTSTKNGNIDNLSFLSLSQLQSYDPTEFNNNSYQPSYARSDIADNNSLSVFNIDNQTTPIIECGGNTCSLNKIDLITGKFVTVTSTQPTQSLNLDNNITRDDFLLNKQYLLVIYNIKINNSNKYTYYLLDLNSKKVFTDTNDINSYITLLF